MTLYNHIRDYNNRNIYPFHMPGHKRNPAFSIDSFLNLDMTEIPEMDNLHQPSGVLLEMQKRIAQIYGSDESYFLVNGSSVGVAAAIACCTDESSKLLLGRNAHRSAYSGLVFSGAAPVYLIPSMTQYGFCGGIDPSKVHKSLSCTKDIAAIFVTSPTYEGAVLDIAAIAQAAHEKGIPLIVDEAHGAHFIYSGYFPTSALELGADIVIHSLHKTLPALTQSAVLHVKGTRVNRSRLQQYLAMLQTSSPSYLLMAYADHFLSVLDQSLFNSYTARLEDFRQSINISDTIELIGNSQLSNNNVYDYDKGKLVFALHADGYNGYDLDRLIRNRYNIQIEMSGYKHLLAMTSVCDTEDGFHRLRQAILEIARDIPYRPLPSTTLSWASVFAGSTMKLTPRESLKQPFIIKNINECCGAVSADFIIPYPPGIPLLVPGEQITPDVIKAVNNCKQDKIALTGGYSETQIKIVEEEDVYLWKKP